MSAETRENSYVALRRVNDVWIVSGSALGNLVESVQLLTHRPAWTTRVPVKKIDFESCKKIESCLNVYQVKLATYKIGYEVKSLFLLRMPPGA